MVRLLIVFKIVLLPFILSAQNVKNQDKLSLILFDRNEYKVDVLHKNRIGCTEWYCRPQAEGTLLSKHIYIGYISYETGHDSLWKYNGVPISEEYYYDNKDSLIKAFTNYKDVLKAFQFNNLTEKVPYAYQVEIAILYSSINLLRLVKLDSSENYKREKIITYLDRDKKVSCYIGIVFSPKPMFIENKKCF